MPKSSSPAHTSKSASAGEGNQSISSARTTATSSRSFSKSTSVSRSTSRTRSSSSSVTKSSTKSMVSKDRHDTNNKEVHSRGRSREPRSRLPKRQQMEEEEKVIEKNLENEVNHNKNIEDEGKDKKEIRKMNIENDKGTNGEQYFKKSKMMDFSQTLSKRLFVGNLTRNVTEAHIKEIFSLWGTLIHAEIAVDRVVQLSKGYAYVEYEKRADAENALKHMNGAQIDGNVIEWLIYYIACVCDRVKFVYVPQRREPMMDGYGMRNRVVRQNDYETQRKREQDIRLTRPSDRDFRRRASPPPPLPQRQRSPAQAAAAPLRGINVRRSRSPLRPIRRRYYNRSPPRRPPPPPRRGYAYDRPVRRPRTRSPIDSRRKYQQKRKSPRRHFSNERAPAKHRRAASKSSSNSKRRSLSSSSPASTSSKSKSSK